MWSGRFGELPAASANWSFSFGDRLRKGRFVFGCLSRSWDRPRHTSHFNSMRSFLRIVTTREGEGSYLALTPHVRGKRNRAVTGRTRRLEARASWAKTYDGFDKGDAELGAGWEGGSEKTGNMNALAYPPLAVNDAYPSCLGSTSPPTTLCVHEPRHPPCNSCTASYSCCQMTLYRTVVCVSTLTLDLHLGTVGDLDPRVVLADPFHELRVVAAAVHQKAAVDPLPILQAYRRSLRGVLHLRNKKTQVWSWTVQSQGMVFVLRGCSPC